MYNLCKQFPLGIEVNEALFLLKDARSEQYLKSFILYSTCYLFKVMWTIVCILYLRAKAFNILGRPLMFWT